MNDLTPIPRRYTDAEVRALLERAAELQVAEPSTEATGMTLAQLEAVAREAGISVDAVRRAAAELETGAAGASGKLATALAGAPVRVVLERTLTGTLDAGALEAAIPVIQTAADAPGQASLVGHTLTWQAQAPNAARDLQVMITSRDGETRIRIEERYTNLAGGLFGGVVGGGGGGVGIGVGVGVGAALGSTVMMVGFPVAVIGMAWLGSRAIFSGIVNRRREVLGRLMLNLAEGLAAEAAAPGTAAPELAEGASSPGLPPGGDDDGAGEPAG